jgi:hypothetical protein
MNRLSVGLGLAPDREAGRQSLLQTEFEFRLPRGWVDGAGGVHRRGVMRLATARDELVAQKDRRVRDYPGYGTLVLLAQVIVQLGDRTSVTPEELEGLFTQDLAYLRDLYNRVNQQGSVNIPTQCPQCSHVFETELVLAGE